MLHALHNYRQDRGKQPGAGYVRVLLLGDTHGHHGWVALAIKEAKKAGCTRILQLGDFGYWEHTGEGRVFLDRVSFYLEKHGIDLTFVDGNHDNEALLLSKYQQGDDGFYELRPRLKHAPRGHRWEWDGLTFLALGGAASIDKDFRLQAETEGWYDYKHRFHGPTGPKTQWFPGEMITSDDEAKAIAGGHADIIASHDCPAGADVFGSHHAEIVHLLSQQNRDALLRVVKEVRPGLLVHGHYHIRRSTRLDFPYAKPGGGHGWHRTLIEGFAQENTWGDSWGILDLEAAKRKLAETA